jgi:hypothetical protein
MQLKLTIFSKLDFTDEFILSLSDEKLSPKQYSDILLSREMKNVNSEKLIKFFCIYDDGFWLPEKCNAYEPINKNFNSEDFRVQISWLSQKGGSLYIKKTKPFKYICEIENKRPALIWDENGKVLKSKYKLDFLSKMTIFISDKVFKYKNNEDIAQFISGLELVFDTNEILLEETGDSVFW